MIAPAAQLLGLLPGEVDQGGGVGGYLHVDFIASVPAYDLAPQPPVYRLDPAAQLRDALNEPWPYKTAPVPRLQRPQAAQVFVHPLADGGVGVLVQGVHLEFVEAAVRVHAVPQLPDGGAAQLHVVEPPGAVLLEEHLPRQVVPPVLRQRPAQHPGARKAGGQVVLVAFKIFAQPLQKPGPVLLPANAELQPHGKAGLGVGEQPPGGGDVLGSQGLEHLFIQRPVLPRLRLIAQQLCGLCHNVNGVEIVHAGHIVGVCGADLLRQFQVPSDFCFARLCLLL